MYNKDEREMGSIYQRVLRERTTGWPGHHSYATIYVSRWISKELMDKFLATNQPIFPQDQIFSNPKQVHGVPVECPDIAVGVSANLSPEGHKWWVDNWNEIKVMEDNPLLDREGAEIPGRILYKAGTPVELTEQEKDSALDKMVADKTSRY